MHFAVCGGQSESFQQGRDMTSVLKMFARSAGGEHMILRAMVTTGNCRGSGRLVRSGW